MTAMFCALSQTASEYTKYDNTIVYITIARM